jgi:hypothetical protein
MAIGYRQDESQLSEEQALSKLNLAVQHDKT